MGSPQSVPSPRLDPTVALTLLVPPALEAIKNVFGRKPERENPILPLLENRFGQNRVVDLGEGGGGGPTSPRANTEDMERINIYLRTSGYRLIPTIWPTEKEYSDAKKKFKYEPENLHFAVTGIAGSGKSALVNSFRGLQASDDGAAETGVNETTAETGRYPHPDRESPLASVVWYDIPGAGTQSTPGGSEYFNDQGLFIFDSIIMVTGDRFTEQDLDILANCKMYNIPSFVVRSKSDIHIRNMKKKTRGCSDDDARKRYIDETRAVFKRELEKAPEALNLDCDKEIFLVSEEGLYGYIRSLMDGGAPEDTGALVGTGGQAGTLIDEQSLVMKILVAAQMRRYPSRYGMGWELLRTFNLMYVFPN